MPSAWFFASSSRRAAGSSSARPPASRTLTETLVRQRHALGPVSAFIGSATFAQTFVPGHCDGLQLTGYGGAGGNRKLIKAGALQQFPVQVSQLPNYFGDTIPCDVRDGAGGSPAC